MGRALPVGAWTCFKNERPTRHLWVRPFMISTMRILETKVPPPIVLLLVGAAMWATAHYAPAAQPRPQWRLFIAGALFAFGLAVSVLGLTAFRRARTTVNPITPEAASSIVSAGIYSYTRNPMYVGLTSILLGWAVWLWVPWVALGPLVFILYIARFQIIPEERVLTAKFGRDYLEYSQRVRRWI